MYVACAHVFVCSAVSKRAAVAFALRSARVGLQVGSDAHFSDQEIDAAKRDFLAAKQVSDAALQVRQLRRIACW